MAGVINLITLMLGIDIKLLDFDQNAESEKNPHPYRNVIYDNISRCCHLIKYLNK